MVATELEHAGLSRGLLRPVPQARSAERFLCLYKAHHVGAQNWSSQDSPEWVASSTLGLLRSAVLVYMAPVWGTLFEHLGLSRGSSASTTPGVFSAVIPFKTHPSWAQYLITQGSPGGGGALRSAILVYSARILGTVFEHSRDF